jgi:predicted O-linked N-acetylglucosamine transferase (SPINDLY family)
MPRVPSEASDADFAQALLRQHGLKGEKTIVLFSGGQKTAQDYPAWGEALAPICRELGFRVIALGTAGQFDVNQRSLAALGLAALGNPGVNLAGKTTPGQSAEVLRLCRLAVGADPQLAQTASAVGTPNLLVLGGGQFAQDLPQSPLTSAVCLPLHCYDCKWQCRYDCVHCVQGIAGGVIEAAARATLAGASDKPRIFVQDRSLWEPKPGEPEWAWFHALAPREKFDLIAVGRNPSTGNFYVNPLRLPQRVWRGQSAAGTERKFSQQRVSAARLCLESSQEVLQRCYAQDIAPLVRKPLVWQTPPSDGELYLMDEILAGLAQEPPGSHWLQYRMAAMLYFLPHELPSLTDLAWAPPWLLDDFVAYTLRGPWFFHEMGEADRYLRFLEDWTAYLHRSVLADRTSPFWRRVATLFLQHAHFIAPYFNEANVKDLFSHRGDLMEFAMKDLGAALDHSFPPVPHGRKIRLGILAGSFGASAETYASLPYYEHLGKDFEVTLYCMGATGHPIEDYCRSRAKELKVLPRDLPGQVSAIRTNDLDLLFFATNVAAVTTPISLLALYRLARAQITSIFSIVSTGMPKMDYYISGDWTDPAPDAQAHYREKLVRMDGSVHCFSHGAAPVGGGISVDRQRLSLPPAAIVFASGANFFKMIPELLHAWGRILALVPDSFLMLFPYGLNWSNAYPKAPYADHLRDIFAHHGIEMSRVRVVDPQPPPDRWGMKEFFKLADVYLDSFPFSGSTSLMEPLEIGLPIVVKQGMQLRGAMAAAMMRELSLPELIAQSEDDYVRLAVELGRDAKSRAEMARRVQTAMQAGPRFTDSRRFAGRIAPLLRKCAGRD